MPKLIFLKKDSFLQNFISIFLENIF